MQARVKFPVWLITSYRGTIDLAAAFVGHYVCFFSESAGIFNAKSVVGDGLYFY
jgi:hypothetical protein